MTEEFTMHDVVMLLSIAGSIIGIFEFLIKPQMLLVKAELRAIEVRIEYLERLFHRDLDRSEYKEGE